MLSQVTLLPKVTYEFECKKENGDIRLLDETGENSLLYIAFETGREWVGLNTYVNGEWGIEEHLPHPPEDEPGHGKIWIKFNGISLEAWTECAGQIFERFDSRSAKHVCFMRKWGNALHFEDLMNVRVLSPETMAIEIDNHVLHKRLNQIEKLVYSQNLSEESKNGN